MPRPSINGRRIHVIVTKPQDKKLTAMSDKTGLPVSELIRRAIDFYVAGGDDAKKD